MVKLARSEHGGVAIEFAIISSLLILGCISTLEFGRALYLRSELSYAADAAERRMLLDTDVSESVITTTVRSTFSGDSGRLTIAVGDETVDSMRFRTLTLGYPIALNVPFFPDAGLRLSVNRRTPVELETTP